MLLWNVLESLDLDSSGEMPNLAAKDRIGWKERPTTKPSNGELVGSDLMASQVFRNSMWLCWPIKTVSADVMQPLQAKQSLSVILARSSFSTCPFYQKQHLKWKRIK